ncbi:MAG: hypothetical protein KGJ02_03865 [Verrucomicrobiota bacterium]|nr:hypothetical protein [Verrucomicrobiota bacterium]
MTFRIGSVLGNRVLTSARLGARSFATESKPDLKKVTLGDITVGEIIDHCGQRLRQATLRDVGKVYVKAIKWGGVGGLLTGVYVGVKAGDSNDTARKMATRVAICGTTGALIGAGNVALTPITLPIRLVKWIFF